MIGPPAKDDVSAFLASALAREGAEAEPSDGRRLFVVLPPNLQGALALPEAAVLRLEGEALPGEVACPLEGAAVQWLLERARGRGRLAGARLSTRCGSASGRLDEVRRRATLPNATLSDARADVQRVVVALLEFGYEARSEERTEGSVFVAAPAGSGVPSLALAAALLNAIGEGEPEAPHLDAAGIALAASSSAACVEEEVRRRIEPFLLDRRRRMDIERERIVAYHERLAREVKARGARGDAQGSEAAGAKRAAIERQRAGRLAELAERHAVETTIGLDSAAVLRYEAVVAHLVLRRRRREIPFDVVWDPFLGEPVGPPCAACRRPTLSVTACDEEGHLACSACARPCPTCMRSHCRACRPAGCGCGSEPGGRRLPA